MTKPNPDLVTRLRQFIEHEARSCSMDIGGITPLYVYRMWGGDVPLDEIEAAMKAINSNSGHSSK